MSIFSRVKKAKKAAEEHKKATVGAQVAEVVKPPSAPYKHIPTHAAQDALSATPTRLSPEETRTKIAEARERRSIMVSSAPATAYQSRASSPTGGPARPPYRTRSDMSIASVAKNPRPHSYKPTPFIPRNSSASSLGPSPEEEYHAVTGQGEVLAPPPVKSRLYHAGPVASSSSSRRRSPLANAPVEEEPEDSFNQSSQASTCSAESSSESSDASGLMMQRQHTTTQRTHHEKKAPVIARDSDTMPAWRYEDYVHETDHSVVAEAPAGKSSGQSVRPLSLFHRPQNTATVAAH